MLPEGVAQDGPSFFFQHTGVMLFDGLNKCITGTLVGIKHRCPKCTTIRNSKNLDQGNIKSMLAWLVDMHVSLRIGVGMSHNPDKAFNSAFALPLAKEILASSTILLALVRSSAIMSDDSFASA